MKDYSIPKSPIPLIYMVISTIVMGEISFGLLIILISVIRDTLNTDGTMYFMFILLLIIKTFIVVGGVSAAMYQWTKRSFMVVDDQLVTYSVGSSSVQSNEDLKDVRSIKVTQNFLGKRSDFGNITIHFSEAAYKETVTLEGVSHPKEIVRRLRKSSKNAK